MCKRRLVLVILSLLWLNGCISNKCDFDIYSLRQTSQVLLCDQVAYYPEIIYKVNTTTSVVSSSVLRCYVDELIDNAGNYDIFVIGFLAHLVFLDNTGRPLGLALISLDGGKTIFYPCKSIDNGLFSISNYDSTYTVSWPFTLAVYNYLTKERPVEIRDMEEDIKQSGVNNLEYMLRYGLMEAKKNSANQISNDGKPLF